MEVIQNEYTSAKQILMFPDHYVAVPQKFTKNDAAVTTTADGKKIVKAGTIYPSNDASARGVVLYDVDVTNGDANGALIVHGFIKVKALPAVPTSAAIAALKDIQFFPLQAAGVTLTGTKITIPVGEVDDPEDPVVLKLNGATFRDGVETLTNWTITGEADTKVSVSKITVSDDNQTIYVTLKVNAAAVAGNVTITPAASIISTGQTVAAVTVATVAAA